MHAWEQIQKAVDYIEDHLSEKPDIENLSEIAALSPFYFQRLFKRLVKKPVMEYIKLRRMARATEVLLQTDRRILDIALEYGFSSHEQFTRTFKSTFGMTPEMYRKAPVALNRMTKPQLLLDYILVDENVPLISDGIILEINRRTLTSPEYFAGFSVKQSVQFITGLGLESGEDPLYSVWESFHHRKANIPDLISGGDELGVSFPCAQEGYFSYFAVGQSTFPAAEGYASWEFSAGEYIVCSFEAETFENLVMDVLYKANHYLFQTWLKNHQIVTEPFAAERYTERSSETASMEIWLKPINND